MLRGNLHLSVVLGLRPVPAEEEIEKFVISAVDIFLTGISGSQPRQSKITARAFRCRSSRGAD
jgi:hypothetical protein